MVGSSTLRSGLLGFALMMAGAARADEGMWLFNRPPARQLEQRYGFQLDPAWLDHLQRSAARVGGGGSGSFVSANGLILTNHHVGAGMIEKLSTAGRDLLKDGFYAATAEEELRCPDMEVNVLQSIEDVTDKVNAAVSADLAPEAAAAARRAAIAAIEKASFESTGFRSDVVTLYQGGAYHLYRFHRYTDVRLVFAPDRQAASFGGDPDNFEYPRYCLDLCFFRAYENGQPAKVEHFLKWNPQGAAEGDLVFVAGHPGRTNRFNTLAQVQDMRDNDLPYRLEQIYRNETTLVAWAARDRENARRAAGSIVGIRNGRKATLARLQGLLDPAFMARKTAEEETLRKGLSSRPDGGEAEAAFERIAAAEKAIQPTSVRARMLESGDAFGTPLFMIARTLLRAAEETPKPDGERLREYQTAGRISLELQLFSDKPVYKDFETVKLANSLTFLCEKLGADDPTVRAILDGRSPQARAAELVEGTHLDDVAVRRALYQGGREAVAASTDPLIVLVRAIDGEARKLRAASEAHAEVIAQAQEKIARARFALGGDAVYPDATASLRLAFGVVKGYREGGQDIPSRTTLGGLYERAEKQGGVAPFELPPLWRDRKTAANLATPFNFVCTADITGGNSGSPVVDRAGQLVGLIFDGNFSSLVLNFGYTEETERAVCVHAAGMLEALRHLYQADRLVRELSDP